MTNPFSKCEEGYLYSLECLRPVGPGLDSLGLEPEEVEETLGTHVEEEPLDQTKLEDVGFDTCSHDIPLSFREVPSLDEPEPQPNHFTNYPSLDVSLGEERGPEPPIKPHSPDSFRMKEIDNLTIHTPLSPHVASFHPKGMYFYYHPCIDDPNKHYGFKPGLLGHSGSLGVNFSNLDMIDDDWKIGSKEVSFLGRGLNLPVKLKEVEKVMIRDSHHLKHIFNDYFSNIWLLFTTMVCTVTITHT
nr:hypothetical protein [Tanacetum cinerariifolium]